MQPLDVTLLAGLVVGFGLLSKRLGESALTPPIAAVLVGLVLGAPGLDWLTLDLQAGPLHVLADLTLTLVLFGDATRIDVRDLRKAFSLPVRMLSIGMLGSIAMGAGLAMLMLPQLGLWEAAALGAALAPTDAALGQAVVTNTAVPQRIRQALNVESGLNDGMVLPFVLVFASLAGMGDAATASHVRPALEWLSFVALQLTVGPAVGVFIAWGAGRLIDRAIARGAMEKSFQKLAGVALALLCYGAAELLGGNGFIAAFIGGITFGHKHRKQRHVLVSFLEAEGQLLMLVVFLGLGSALAVPALRRAPLAVIGYALASLTVVRLLPTALSLLGSGLRPTSYLFLGWFGPRGLASLLYAILLLHDASLPHEQLVFDTVVVTVLMSVFLHGMTAAVGARLYAGAVREEARAQAEHERVLEHPWRRTR